MRVIAMTPEQINMLPPPERAGIIQLVSYVPFLRIPYSSRIFCDLLRLSFPLDIDGRHPPSFHRLAVAAPENLDSIFPHVSTTLYPPRLLASVSYSVRH